MPFGCNCISAAASRPCLVMMMGKGIRAFEHNCLQACVCLDLCEEAGRGGDWALYRDTSCWVGEENVVRALLEG